MKGSFINELQPGSDFGPSLFRLCDASVRTAKNGNDYLVCNLVDRTGSAPAKMWNISAEQREIGLTAQFVEVKGSVQAGEYAGSVVIERLKARAVPEDPADFVAALRDGHSEQQDRFRSMIETVEQTYLRQLLDRIFAPEGAVWKEFCGAVAAKGFHHAYRGGLLDHTLEVAELCDGACKVIPSLRRDFLVTSALLHDIGKLEEIDHGLNQGEYLPAGNLIGHIVLGAMSIGAVADGIPGFPTDLKHGVVHMILSHHGKLEFGSPKTPLTAEAQVLASNDQLSARLDQSREALETAVDGKHTVRVKGWDSAFMHAGSFGLDEVAVIERVVETTVVATTVVETVTVAEPLAPVDSPAQEEREAAAEGSKATVVEPAAEASPWKVVESFSPTGSLF